MAASPDGSVHKYVIIIHCISSLSHGYDKASDMES